MINTIAQPKTLSLVTINYNGAGHLEECIESVVSQMTDKVEYFIVDGGSTDQSVEIIKRYEKHLSGWVSETDRGPADAINKGLRMSTGLWFNWLNSDDYLLPGAVHNLLEIFELIPSSEWLTCTRLTQYNSGFVEPSGLWHKHWQKYITGEADFAQDSTFLKSKLLRELGGLNINCQSCFDRELYLRLLKRGLPAFCTLPTSVFRRALGQLSLDEEKRSKDLQILNSEYSKRSAFKRLLEKLATKRYGIQTLNFLISIGAFSEINNSVIIYFNIKSFSWQTAKKIDQPL